MGDSTPRLGGRPAPGVRRGVQQAAVFRSLTASFAVGPRARDLRGSGGLSGVGLATPGLERRRGSTERSLVDGVKVAQQILVLLVQVRILVDQFSCC